MVADGHNIVGMGRQNIVQRPENPSVLRVMGVCKLLTFFGMATGAVLWRHNGSDPLPFMIKRVRLTLFGHMAFEAADIGTEVLAVAPLLVDRPIFQPVATDARLGLLRYFRQPPRLGAGNRNQ